MAYDPHQLSALAYSNGFTAWHYRTADSVDEVQAEDYFAAARSMLRNGDAIHLVQHAPGDRNTIKAAGLVYVCGDHNTIGIVGSAKL